MRPGRIALAAALATLALAPAGFGKASPRQYAFEQYRAVVRQTAGELARAVRRQSRGQTARSQTLRALVGTLSVPALVRTGLAGPAGEATVRVQPLFDVEDQALLLPPGRDPSLESLMLGLRRARLALLALESPRTADEAARAADAEKLLRGVVDSPEFRSSRFEDFILRAQRAVVLFISRLLGASFAGGRSRAVEAITKLLIAAIAVSLALLAWYVIAHSPRPARRKEHSTEQPAAEEPRADATEAEAREALARGDYRTSLRLAYRSLLLKLSESGILRMEPGMTNREALRRIGRPALDVMRPATASFDERVYGRRETTADDCVQMLSLHSHLMGQA